MAKTVAPTSQHPGNGADLSHAKVAVKNAAKTAADSVMDAAERARDAGSDLAKTAQDAGEKAIKGGQDMVTDAHGQFTDSVKRNPTAMILGAVGLGVLIGLSLRQRG